MNNLHDEAEGIIKKTLDMGARDVEVTVNETQIGMARFRNKGIQQNIDGHRPLGVSPRSLGYSPTGLMIRLITKQGKLGVASATTRSHIEESIKDALQCADYGPELESFLEPRKAVPLSGLYFEDTAQVSPEERVECINHMVDVARGVDSRIGFVGGLLSNVSSHTVIANSLGLDAEHSYTGGQVILTAIAKDGNREGTGYFRKSHRDFHCIDFESTAQNAARDAVAAIGYQNRFATIGKQEVILKAEAAAEFLGTIIQEAFSVTRSPRPTSKTPTGEQVFSERLTVIDNGRDARTLLASSIDGEGTPKKALCLINHGVPENRCYDSVSGKREGRESTGHASPSWGEFFFTGTGSGQTYLPTNQIIEPGNSDLDQLVAGTKSGILVTRLRCPGSRGHTIHPDTIRADTQECWQIRDGEIVGPSNNVRFTDSLVETLKNIEVGDESTVQSVGSFVVPAIKLNSLYISQQSIVMIQ